MPHPRTADLLNTFGNLVRSANKYVNTFEGPVIFQVSFKGGEEKPSVKIINSPSSPMSAHKKLEQETAQQDLLLRAKDCASGLTRFPALSRIYTWQLEFDRTNNATYILARFQNHRVLRAHSPWEKLRERIEHLIDHLAHIEETPIQAWLAVPSYIVLNKDKNTAWPLPDQNIDPPVWAGSLEAAAIVYEVLCAAKYGHPLYNLRSSPTGFAPIGEALLPKGFAPKIAQASTSEPSVSHDKSADDPSLVGL